MTGPINFNPFTGVKGSENIEQFQDRRKSLRFPEIDLSPVDLSFGQDEEADVNLDTLNFDFKKNFSEKQ